MRLVVAEQPGDVLAPPRVELSAFGVCAQFVAGGLPRLLGAVAIGARRARTLEQLLQAIAGGARRVAHVIAPTALRSRPASARSSPSDCSIPSASTLRSGIEARSPLRPKDTRPS